MMKFRPFTGRYVFHCHILEHEDDDMMRLFEVVERRCQCEDECAYSILFLPTYLR
ncbi:multicopper oxidase domain-containing protein [Bacillus sp. S/N-304-OC-R1]|nr:multicopper oxidase domain-containing protein [Bacillus sp. S/N-304-OC-R1]